MFCVCGCRAKTQDTTHNLQVILIVLYIFLSPCIWGDGENHVISYVYVISVCLRIFHGIDKGGIVTIIDVNPMDKPYIRSMSCKCLMCSKFKGKNTS